MGAALCSGHLVLDILVRPADTIRWGGTTWVEAIEQHLGGNGASTSYTLAKLGVPVRLAGLVGRDAFGEYLLERLAGAGVDTGGVGRSAAPTTTTVALVRTNGDRALLLRPGASSEMFLEPEAWRREFAGRSHYHLASPFGLPRLRPHQPEILRLAKAAGLSTSVDTHWDTEGRWLADLGPCLPHTDILFGNEDEARMLTGVADPAAAAARLRREGARTVVIKLGRAGCAVFGPEGEFHSPAFAVTAVDTTGAGDCFVGGYLAARERGGGPAEAARFANAVAAMAVEHLGATNGVRTWNETTAWMQAARTA
ncbi:MAG TPA: carbohydrate kinase family protein [Bryobacteraceae bacterium]|nr:carbohydrate kinase family protein [Bryobacteraceae bacterium]